MTLSVHAITVDCADAAAVAGFWAGVLGRPVEDGASTDFASIDGTPRWLFVKVPEPKSVKNRVHVDLVADDRAAEVDRVVGLGATRVAEFDEDGSTWTTLADPEGNEFDIAEA